MISVLKNFMIISLYFFSNMDSITIKVPINKRSFDEVIINLYNVRDISNLSNLPSIDLSNVNLNNILHQYYVASSSSRLPVISYSFINTSNCDVNMCLIISKSINLLKHQCSHTDVISSVPNLTCTPPQNIIFLGLVAAFFGEGTV